MSICYTVSGPDTGVDTLHKVEGPGALGGPGGPRPSRDNEKKKRTGEKEDKIGDNNKRERKKKEKNECS